MNVLMTEFLKSSPNTVIRMLKPLALRQSMKWE
jgi:hypothetical protein